MKGRVLEALLVSVLLLSGSLGAREVDDEALARGRGAREFRSTGRGSSGG